MWSHICGTVALAFDRPYRLFTDALRPPFQGGLSGGRNPGLKPGYNPGLFSQAISWPRADTISESSHTKHFSRAHRTLTHENPATSHCSVLSAHCSLLTAHSLQLTAYSLLITARLPIVRQAGRRAAKRIDDLCTNQGIGKSDRQLDHCASRPFAVRSTAVKKEITD